MTDHDICVPTVAQPQHRTQSMEEKERFKKKSLSARTPLPNIWLFVSYSMRLQTIHGRPWFSPKHPSKCKIHQTLY